jgi:2',3'-cyclic-nucleotide 2'-phosphodiesterase (5'-nucleotidase family)/predicted AlkP superfamily phosphohydrolase/phosphomutase
MRRWARWLAPTVVGAAALILTLTAGTATAKRDGRPIEKVVMFASDGMRPDLMERYAKQGAMPTYRKLMKEGATGSNGMVQAFPPNTGVGWYTMATGTYPSEHGSTNNTYFRSGDAFGNRTAFSAANTMQADTIANAAERAGKKVAQIDWVGGAAANIQGPTVDFTNFFSNRGVLVGQADATEQAGSAFFGVTYQVSAAPANASGWSNVPAGDPAATPKETTWTIPTTFAAQNPNRTYNVYFYDSVTGGGARYDHAIVSPVGKTGASPSIDLKVGDFLPIKLTGANGLIGARAGQSVGHYVKLISLAPDLGNFKLYDTSLARAIAKCGTPCDGLPAGGAGEDRLEKYIADNLLPWAAADFAPEEAGVIDEDTYVQQGRDLERAYSLEVIRFILGTLQPDTDLAMVGYPFTDEVSHQFMGLVSPTDPDGSPNPCYDVNPKFDDVQCTGRGTAHRVAIREEYIRSAYADADEKLGITRDLLGGNPVTFAGSDHGFAPQRYAVNANNVLNQSTVNGISLHASNASASNCSAATTDLTKACWAGGTVQIHVNPTLPSGTTYEQVRTAVRNAFANVTDPANPTKQVVLRIMNKEELRNVDGSDSLHPNRSGDVVVVLNPPYQSDAGTANQTIALSHFFGQHGYLPNTVDLANNINMHGTFVLGGPDINNKDGITGLRAIDVAPTLSFLMGIPGPQNARGRILYDLVKDAHDLTEVTILDISDWHAQLTPLSEASDNLAAPAVNPSFGIGGSAFLKSWFDAYERESALSSDNGKANILEVAGGDSFGGATPPISNFFGDKPTPPIMGMMGIDIDAIGNHSFDRGQTYLRNELISLAPFPMISANVVDGTSGLTPAEWSPSHVFTFDHGVKLGFVGFTTESTPGIVFPGNLDPFVVNPVVPAVNAAAAALAGSTDAIVALGHEGATGGTVTEPTGPLADIADSVQNVDAVIGDHNDLQVDSLRSNGVLTTENRGKGIRFTRIRLVIGPGQEGVVYKTADYHKPWTIGVTPDPAIQARIDELNAQLAPILGTGIGESTKFIPRADQCGGGTGRTCESLVGNVVTDSMRTRYSSIGVQFAVTNSGGLRADLTCPNPDLAGDFCPSYTPPPYPITRGQSLAVLPFGNIVVTLSVNGAELKTMLENGVSRMPAVDGRFPQVSGLCFTYDIAAAAGSRVTSAEVANADGSCTSTPVDLTAASTYKIAENDFMATGGDGYPNFASRMTTQDIMEQVTADYITASSPLSPAVRAFPNGRINCADSNGAAAPNCPPLVPSP